MHPTSKRISVWKLDYASPPYPQDCIPPDQHPNRYTGIFTCASNSGEHSVMQEECDPASSCSAHRNYHLRMDMRGYSCGNQRTDITLRAGDRPDSALFECCRDRNPFLCPRLRGISRFLEGDRHVDCVRKGRACPVLKDVITRTHRRRSPNVDCAIVDGHDAE